MSAVRETIHKFGMHAISNKLSSSPPPLPPSLHRPSLPITINNNHINESPTLSVISSTESTHSEPTIHSNSIEQNTTQSYRTSITNSTIQTSQLSNTRLDIRPLIQQKPTKSRRRTPPPIPLKCRSNAADTPIYMNSDNEFEGTTAFKAFTKPVTAYKELRVLSSIQTTENNQRPRVEKPPTPPRVPFSPFKNDDMNSIGLEITEPTPTTRRQVIVNNGYRIDRGNNVQHAPTIIEHYEVDDSNDQRQDIGLPSYRRPSPPAPPLPPALTYLQRQSIVQEESQSDEPKRTLTFSNFMVELGALIAIFILCMVLILAIRENENLRITMLTAYIYIYAFSIIWMIWCTLDIMRFRRNWTKTTRPAINQEEYMAMPESHLNKMVYFPDIDNTGGLFMRIGAGLLCMGGLALTAIELARTIAGVVDDRSTRALLPTNYSPPVAIARSITYILRFLFHCVQFTFLFRYGNLIIDRYHLFARIGIIHVVIANLCTWFEAIVFETLEQLDKKPLDSTTTATTTALITEFNNTNSSVLDFIREVRASSNDVANDNPTTLEVISKIEATMSSYLYPCLIEYSLISLTVFFIMLRNVGKNEKRSLLRFGARHVFTINCARASRGLLGGGFIFVLTILTLIPTYMVNVDAVSVTHITELILLILGLITVCLSFFHTTKLYYDRHAHVDIFDQALILITTIGDFAYTFFSLFASLLIENPGTKLPVGIQTAIGFLAIFETFLQTGFIMDTLKRRTKTQQDIRNKPGREMVTALLLINLAIWMHDSLSAKKVILNPLQTAYYVNGAWPIIQAFTSPLSIFYRFHSTVCLADIWQEAYKDNGNEDKHRLMNINGGQDSTN